MLTTEWTQHVGKGRWIIALRSPVPPTVLSYLLETYKIERVQPLPSGNVAFYLWAARENVAQLMTQPKPKYGGSQHECNLTRW